MESRPARFTQPGSRWSGGRSAVAVVATLVLAVDRPPLHLEHQRGDDGDSGPLVTALAKLYAYAYGVDEEAVRPAAEHRAQAMDISDRWVTEGCALDSPLLPAERAELICSYTALLAAVHR